MSSDLALRIGTLSHNPSKQRLDKDLQEEDLNPEISRKILTQTQRHPPTHHHRTKIEKLEGREWAQEKVREEWNPAGGDQTAEGRAGGGEELETGNLFV